jgi:phenylalanyl-tRNA synthetase alpha chain
MADDLDTLRDAALGDLIRTRNLSDLEAVRVKYVGRKGALTRALRSIPALRPGERAAFGERANRIKSELEVRIRSRRDELESNERGPREEDSFDVTLPGLRPLRGRLHPLTQILEDIAAIFRRMGFSVASGPDVETDYYNFQALNTPPDHPARDTQATFYVSDRVLLRTQTSPVQIRVMEKQKPPVRIIAPGRCFRRDAIDASHYPTFYQVEGLYVDRTVTFAQLKRDLSRFAEELLGEAVKVRFRPHFFPFTEPSAEYDFSCFLCHGQGCRVCKGSGWLEISGAGMVDPAVFETVGYDPEVYSGYAFGMGVERIAMLKYGIDDIRLFYENDLRFLEQF